MDGKTRSEEGIGSRKEEVYCREVVASRKSAKVETVTAFAHEVVAYEDGVEWKHELRMSWARRAFALVESPTAGQRRTVRARRWGLHDEKKLAPLGSPSEILTRGRWSCELAMG